MFGDVGYATHRQQELKHFLEALGFKWGFFTQLLGLDRVSLSCPPPSHATTSTSPSGLTNQAPPLTWAMLQLSPAFAQASLILNPQLSPAFAQASLILKPLHYVVPSPVGAGFTQRPLW